MVRRFQLESARPLTALIGQQTAQGLKAGQCLVAKKVISDKGLR
jgi:hypothetical protein